MPSPVADSDLTGRFGENVPHPLRFVPVLGENVEAALGLHEPDLNFPAKARLPASRGQVENVGIERFGQEHSPPMERVLVVM